MRYPLVSIVTVVYNGAINIEDTILSILNQDYQNIEYIIIDGGSKDNTIEVVNKYIEKVDVLISEPDNGIYDAMNKAISLCKGEWINFMNVGDLFYDNNTLSKIFNTNRDHSDIIYGNHQVIYPQTLINKYPVPLYNIWKGMPMQHQSIFVKKDIFQKVNFNLKYKFAADYDLIFHSFINGAKFTYINENISKVSANGYSESNSISTYLEFKNISLKYQNTITHKLYFYFLIPYRKFILLVKEVLKMNKLSCKLKYQYK
jgi:glycosyltransferase involved in cell wall biosynthesis